MMIGKMQKLVDEIGLIEVIRNGTQLFVRRQILTAQANTVNCCTPRQRKWFAITSRKCA